MKHIVICSDGTGNTAIKGRGTNVFKLFEAVDVIGHKEGSIRPKGLGGFVRMDSQAGIKKIPQITRSIK
jgi:uncharacterized protein (DUF2235 family)